MITGRTFDEQFIYRCVIANWKHIRDDGSPSPELYFPPMDKSIYWLEINDGRLVAEKLGVIMAHPLNAVCYEVHICFLPHAKGYALDACLAALDWLFENTPAERLVANVIPENELAISLAKRVGFVEFGRNIKSRKIDGILHDEIMLGISKEER